MILLPPWQNLEYRYLKAFMLTAQFRSFSIAAQKLHVAQSAISRQIKLLEQSLGEQLIVRSPKNILLTKKGEQLLKACWQFEKLLAEVWAPTQDLTLKVGIVHGLLENWFHDVLIKYYQRHQHNLEVYIHSLKELKEHLSSGQYDLIITTENIQSEIMTARKLFHENLVLISKNKITMGQLPQQRWIVYNQEDPLLKLKKISPQVLVINSMTTIVNLVKKGLGVAVVPEHLLQPQDKLQRLKFDTLRTNINVPAVYLCTLNYKNLPVYLQELVQIILSCNSLPSSASTTR